MILQDYISAIFNRENTKLVMLHFLFFTLCIFILFSYALCAMFCLFNYLLFCIYALYVHYPACLIFCNGFAHSFIHFCCQIVHFYTLCFLQVFLGATSSCYTISSCHNSLFFATRTCYRHHVDYNVSFNDADTFFRCVVTRFSTWFFSL